jgi:hypothetical protein
MAQPNQFRQLARVDEVLIVLFCLMDHTCALPMTGPRCLYHSQ